MRSTRVSAALVTSAILLSASGLCAQQPAAPPTPPASPAAPAATQAPAKKSERKPIYDEKADAKAQIAAAVAAAKKENRRVLIQWGANWCGWCHLLHETCAANGELKKELNYEYDIVQVDIGRFDKNMDLAAAYGADLKASGVPFLTVLDASGKAIANQETSSLEDGDHHDPAKVLAFLKANQAEYLTAESLLSEGMKQAAAENKVVFLHFGAPWCGWCHKLEDWMALPSTNMILAKDFVDVKVDVDRTIGGQDMLKRYAGPRSGGIPWFAFINARTDEIIITSNDASGSNIGFPAKENEIAHFGDMLRKACTNANPAEIDALLGQLKAASKNNP